MKAGNIDAAVELSRQTNTLSGITGRVCPQDRLCEGACTIRDGHGAVTIGNIKRYVSDQALAKGWRPGLSHVTKVDKRVTIIEAGPAGLAYVGALIRNSVAVTMYDCHPEIDGLFTFGILSFKLDRSLLAHHREISSMMGIHFEPNCEAGKDVSLDSLLEQHDTVFVDVGTYHPMKTGPPNEGVPGVYDALSFLIANTKQAMRLEELPEEPFINTTGFNVVVLGDGDTAMGCVRTVLRHGASNVACTYYRDEANIPGLKKEVRNVREEKANFEFNVQPAALELNEQGHVRGIRFPCTRPDEPDVQGRWWPVPIEDSEFVMPIDAVIMAFSFNPHGMSRLRSYSVTIDKQSRTIVDVEGQYRYQTTNPRAFTGGGAVRGVDLVATTMVEGRHVARDIIDWPGVKSTKSYW